MGLLKIHIFLHSEYGPHISPNVITSRLSPHENHEDVFINFGVIMNTDVHADKQVNTSKAMPSLMEIMTDICSFFKVMFSRLI